MSTQLRIENSSILRGDDLIAILEKDGETLKVVSDTRLNPNFKGQINSLLGVKAVFQVGDGTSESDDELREGKVPAPEWNPALGDLAPEYVEWYRDNHTEAEFAAKYGRRLEQI